MSELSVGNILEIKSSGSVNFRFGRATLANALRAIVGANEVERIILNIQTAQSPQRTNLTDLARKAPKFDTEFVDTLRTEGRRRLSEARDVLVAHPSSGSPEEMKVVKDLEDFRSSLVTVYSRTDLESTQNLKAAIRLSHELKPKPAESVELQEHWSRDPWDKVTREFEEENIYVSHLIAKPQGLNGIGAYLRDLTKVLGIATSALPPGPVAVSLQEFAREESPSNPAGEVQTEENFKATLDDLSQRLDQMTTFPDRTLSIKGERHYEDMGHKVRRFFKDTERVIYESKRANRGVPESRVIHTLPFQVSHPLIPESGVAK